MARRGWIYVLAAIALVLASCGGGKSSSSAGSTTTAAKGGAQTVSVQVDSSPASTQVAFTAYFPNQLTLHPGDTVDFKSNFSGEPHTVTFGTLVDAGLAKVDPKAGGGGDEPAELKKIPTLLPNGPGDAIQAAAQPCFLPSGDPPASDACSKDQQKQPAFDGTQTYYNSGFLADGDTFTLKLADGIKPGTYSYFCTLHRAGMTGKITVVGADQKAQTADDVKQAGQTALSDAQAKIKPTLDAIKAGTLPPFITSATPGGVIAGGGSQDQQDAVPVLFGPKSIDVKVGDTVTWTIVGPHTIAFGANEGLRAAIARAPDGAVHLNPDSFKPAGGDGQPQGPPPDPKAPPGPPTPINGGSYDGNGLHNSGLVLSFPPQLFSYHVKFTKAGSFEYVCLVHPDMKGVVNVG